ncbi:MAG: hypothetical protein OXI75_03945 [Rhodospirillales bacterium]|nr:hypothetical protein [Rhodospirillales bacterium]
MAAVVLSPYPASTAAVARQAARECIKEALGTEVSDDRVDALGQMASDLIEEYAGGAPQSLKNESVLRVCGRALEMPAASRRESKIGDISASYTPSMTGMLHHAGVKSLLAPWRQRRAGVAR